MDADTNRLAIVTVASRGIGAAIAVRLAANGFTVVVNYAGGATDDEALIAKIETAGGKAIPAQADVSDPVAVARMFDAAQTAFGGVDVLVNNAGIMKLACRELGTSRRYTGCNPIRVCQLHLHLAIAPLEHRTCAYCRLGRGR